MPYCPSCGAHVTSRDRYCASCGAALQPEAAEARTSAPGGVPPTESVTPPAGASPPPAPEQDGLLRADIPTARAPDGMRYAGLLSRGFAQLIDTALVVVLYWFIGVEIAARVGGRLPGGFELEGGPALLLFGLWMFGALLYYGLLEGFWNGQTIGKKVARIRVVSESGAPCSFFQAIVRNVIRPIDFIFFYGMGVFFILISPKNQRLGDQAADTIVVHTT